MRIARSVTATSHSTVAFHSREPGETCDRNEMVAVGFSSKRYRRLRLATFLPFTAGVFLGTLITLFLVLSLRSIDGDTRSAESFRQRSAASLKMPSMPRGFRAEEKDTSGPSANTAIKTTPRVTAMAAYFVVVPGVELKTRGLAAHKTWASDLGKRVSFYLCPAGTTEEIDFAYKKRIPLVSLSSTGRSSSARESDGRTTSRGILRAWQDVCEREMGNYRWYVKVEDTSYVHPFRLESVLNALNSSEAHFIGHRVVPEGVEGEELGLREGESYCMELGYALSLGAMQRLCPMLKFCQNNARSENEDVELARCVGLSSGVNCTSAREVSFMYIILLGFPQIIFCSVTYFPPPPPFSSPPFHLYTVSLFSPDAGPVLQGTYSPHGRGAPAGRPPAQPQHQESPPAQSPHTLRTFLSPPLPLC